MAFTDHKISAFTHKISDLADQPNLPPDELKARFDACPEELRQAVNAICDDADRLDERVTGIVAGTFTDSISKDMLTEEVQAQLDSAVQQSAIDAETTAREKADTALSNRINSMSTIVSNKCQVFAGAYLGSGETSQEIYLGWQPEVIIIMQHTFRVESSNYVTGGMIMALNPIKSGQTIGGEIITNGFRVYQRDNLQLNTNNMPYSYLAFH